MRYYDENLRVLWRPTSNGIVKTYHRFTSDEDAHDRARAIYEMREIPARSRVPDDVDPGPGQPDTPGSGQPK